MVHPTAPLRSTALQPRARFARDGREMCVLFVREGGKGRRGRPRSRYLRTIGLELLQLRAPRGGQALLQPAPRSGRDGRARLLLVQDLPDLPRGPAC